MNLFIINMYKNKRIKFLVKLLITIIILYFIISRLGGLNSVGRIIININFLGVLLILFANTLDRFLMTFKWTLLLRSKSINIPIFWGIKLYCASMVWGMFLPATIGSDTYRAIQASKKGFDTKEVIASIVIERIIGFLATLFLGLLGFLLLFFNGNLDSKYQLAWLVGILSLVGLTLMFVFSLSDRFFNFIHVELLHKFREIAIVKKIRQFQENYKKYKNEKSVLTKFLGLTFLEQLFPILISWLIAKSLNIDINFLYLAAAVPISLFISRIPISINKIGVYDGVFMLLMSLAGLSASQAIAITIVGKIIETFSWVPWWIAYIFDSRTLYPPKQAISKTIIGK